MYCESSKLLVEKLKEMGGNALRVFPDGNYRPKHNDLVINWGCSNPPQWKNPLQYTFTLINPWNSIPNAINKVASFARFKATGVSCPEATVDAARARTWIREGKIVVGRSTLTGRAGQGIIILDSLEQFDQTPILPLYSVYKPKKKEFRVHVFNSSVSDAQEKRRVRGTGINANSKIRTHGNGWVFCRENVVLPKDAEEESIKAVAALGLLFGGVDVIWNEKEDRSYVLEVNSAPGIEGTTVIKYADEIIKFAQ